MDMLKKVACLAVLCMVMISPYAEAAITCGQVSGSLGPCLPYLQKGGAPSAPCCAGVKKIKSAANTTPDRQATCKCLQAAARATNINGQLASKLPGACGVSIPYPISTSTDCSKIQ